MKRSVRARWRSLLPAAWLLLAVAGAAVVAGCSNGNAGSSGSAASQFGAAANDGSGSISFELTTPSGLTFTSFTYAVVGPNFTQGGSVNVSHSTTISALIDNLPSGPGYTMTLLGSAAAPNQATCSGSSPFVVTAGQVTDVSVSLACHVVQRQQPPAVPVPPYAPVVLGFVLLALGTFVMGRRRETA